MGLYDGTNPYVYVHGSPLHYRDPDGQFAFLAINPYTIALGTAAVGVAICWATNCGAPAVEAATQAQQAYQAPYVLAVATTVNAVKDMCSEDGDNDKCGPLNRVQAYAEAQAISQISRRERYKRPVDESSLNKSSMGRCYAGLRGSGASHLGYGCKWQDSWIEDHPDGHSHLPGEEHHDCPHLHVYVNGQKVATIKYKRGF